MNLAHLNLLSNHLPIIDPILGAFILAQGFLTKRYQTKIAAYNIFIITAIGACLAYFIGEAAEESVRRKFTRCIGKQFESNRMKKKMMIKINFPSSP